MSELNPQALGEREVSLPVFEYKKQYFNNTKIARSILKRPILNREEKGGFLVAINDTASDMVELWTDEKDALEIIEPFDRDVMDAAYTIMNSGYSILTAEWIAKVMSGNPEQNVTEQKIAAIRRSLDKLQRIGIRIDCTEEMTLRSDAENREEGFVFESKLLPLRKVNAKFVANGKRVTAYQVLEKSALYIYAEKVHQIIDIPKSYLETGNAFSNTENAILIKRYVVKRVMQIISDNKLKSNKLSYIWYDKYGEGRGLYAELGFNPDENPTQWRKKMKPMIKMVVVGTLNVLVAHGIIIGFEEYRERNTHNPCFPVLGYRIIS